MAAEEVDVACRQVCVLKKLNNFMEMKKSPKEFFYSKKVTIIPASVIYKVLGKEEQSCFKTTALNLQGSKTIKSTVPV